MRIGAMMFAAVAGFGQAPSPQFEVASVKLHPPEIRFVPPKVSGPRATWTAYALTELVMDAYQVQPYQISGGPAWLNSDSFDIDAKAAGNEELTKDQVAHMLRGLLEDRFHLRVHRESKEMQIYALVVAKGGPKLKEAGPDAQFRMGLRTKGAVMEMEATKWTTDRLALQLSVDQGRKVMNMTGLTGNYDFTLRYVDERNSAAADADAPSIFGALQEQLGLKVETRKGPVEMLVIDHADRPSQN